jgi:geranylgeranyl pyrophosphate synthase
MMRVFYDYGLLIGKAYQLMDDIADYQLSIDQWGRGHDFIEKKITFPLLLAYQQKDNELCQAFLLQDRPLEWVKERMSPYLMDTYTLVESYELDARRLLLAHFPLMQLKPLLDFHNKWIAPGFKCK